MAGFYLWLENDCYADRNPSWAKLGEPLRKQVWFVTRLDYRPATRPKSDIQATVRVFLQKNTLRRRFYFFKNMLQKLMTLTQDEMVINRSHYPSYFFTKWELHLRLQMGRNFVFCASFFVAPEDGRSQKDIRPCLSPSSSHLLHVFRTPYPNGTVYTFTQAAGHW